METRTFRTNLNCGKCVAKAAVFLDADPEVGQWSVQTGDARKLLTVSGAHVQQDRIRALVKQSGFEVFEEIGEQTPQPSVETYFPLLLILFYLTGFIALAQLKAGHFDGMTAMTQFMGGFFLIFSFFKLLNLKGFAEAYGSYDLLAARLPVYGYVYPFIELALGICYIGSFAPLATNIATTVVMTFSTVGVLRSLMRKTRIQCACLGTVFNLPMSKVTLIEDLLMVGMSAATIALLVTVPVISKAKL
jgi:hypothetical protein